MSCGLSASGRTTGCAWARARVRSATAAAPGPARGAAVERERDEAATSGGPTETAERTRTSALGVPPRGRRRPAPEPSSSATATRAAAPRRAQPPLLDRAVGAELEALRARRSPRGTLQRRRVPIWARESATAIGQLLEHHPAAARERSSGGDHTNSCRRTARPPAARPSHPPGSATSTSWSQPPEHVAAVADIEADLAARPMLAKGPHERRDESRPPRHRAQAQHAGPSPATPAPPARPARAGRGRPPVARVPSPPRSGGPTADALGHSTPTSRSTRPRGRHRRLRDTSRRRASRAAPDDARKASSWVKVTAWEAVNL